MNQRKKQLSWAQLKAGVVVTAALAVLLLVVLFSGGIEGLFAPHAEVKFRLQDVQGLRAGAPVWLLGVEVGTVENIDLTRQGSVVTLSIRKSALKYVHNNAHATVATMGLLGDKFVEIWPGDPRAEAVEAGAFIEGRSGTELGDVVATSVRSIEQVEDFIGTLDSMIAKIDQGKGSLSMLINDSALYVKAVQMTRSALEYVRHVQRAQGTLQRLVEDPALYAQMKSAAAGVDAMMAQINRGPGTLHRLIEDPALYNDLAIAASGLASLARSFDNGGGAAGTLLRDEQFATALEQTVFNIRDLTKDMKERPGRYFKFELF